MHLWLPSWEQHSMVSSSLMSQQYKNSKKITKAAHSEDMPYYLGNIVEALYCA